MTQAPTPGSEAVETNENLPFADRVRAEYERIVPEGSKFDWYRRVESFVSQGSQTLWREYQSASTTEKIVIGGVAVVGAYLGLKLLKAAVDAVFNLGKWMIEKIDSIRKDSVELILKLTLGAAGIALVPILYEAIAKGKLSLSEITQTWDKDGAKGVIALIASKFPEGISSMSEDVKNFIIGIIGADRFKDLFGQGETDTPTPEMPTKPGIKPEDVEIEDGILGVFLTEETKTHVRNWVAGTGSWGMVWRSLIGNEGGVIVSNGSAYIMNEAGQLADFSRWATFQYLGSWKDAINIANEVPEKWWEGLIGGYLAEAPKFIIAANTIDAIMSIFNKVPYNMVRSTFSGVAWGVTVPLRVYNLGNKLFGKIPAFIKFVPGGIVFVTKSGVNIAKYTAQGTLLVWKGGQFVLSQVARQTARLSLAKTIGSVIGRTYVSTIGKQVANFTSQGFMKRLFAIAGWKGATAAALWADDATVIGVLDDIVAVGLTAWLAVDVYDLVQITRRAMIFKSKMTEQQGLEIINIEGIDAATESKLAELESDTGFDEAAANTLFSSMAKAEFRITRSNGVSEEYIMIRGKIISVKVVENGITVAEFSEDDVEKLSQNLPAPQDFKAWEINYDQDKETLMAHYRLVFQFVVNETGWSELDYEIVNENKIIIKRRTTEQSIEINRRGNQWFIGQDSQTAFDLFQAISMANLINRVEMVILNQTSMPSGDSPFYADADGVYVSRFGFDTTILEGEEDSWYRRFYQAQLDLDPEIISKTLNTHYQNYIKSRLNDKIEDYMKDFIPG